MSDKLKINFIAPQANLSGGTKSNRLIAEAMVRRGHEVNIAFGRKRRPWPKIWQTRRWLQRVRDKIAVAGKKQHHLQYSSANLIPVDREKVHAEDVPDSDVVIATWWETREWIDEWPESKGLKAYFVRHHELHGGDPDRVRRTYRMPGLKFVNSRWLQKLMADEYGDDNAVLVWNGVDRDQFQSRPRGKQEVPTVGFMYSRSPYKGSAVAFDSVRKIREKHPNLRAIAYGATPIVRKDHPPPGLEFHLKPGQDVLPNLYRRVDCWIVPSMSEGFGMPGLEAAACHCPVVSTLCGGPEDYVEDGVSGYLVPVGDSTAIADAVCRILDLSDSAWRTMSEASYERTKEFDWDKSAERLEETLLSAVRKSPELKSCGGG